MKILKNELENFLHVFCEPNSHLTLMQYFQVCRIDVLIFKIFNQSNKLAYKIAGSGSCTLFFYPDEEDFGLAYGRQNSGSRKNTTQFHYPVNNITVVMNSTAGNVITVRDGPLSNSCATRGVKVNKEKLFELIAGYRNGSLSLDSFCFNAELVFGEFFKENTHLEFSRVINCIYVLEEINALTLDEVRPINQAEKAEIDIQIALIERFVRS